MDAHQTIQTAGTHRGSFVSFHLPAHIFKCHQKQCEAAIELILIHLIWPLRWCSSMGVSVDMTSWAASNKFVFSLGAIYASIGYPTTSLRQKQCWPCEIFEERNTKRIVMHKTHGSVALILSSVTFVRYLDIAHNDTAKRRCRHLVALSDAIGEFTTNLFSYDRPTG